MQIHKNIQIAGSDGFPVLVDVTQADGADRLPVVIYCHGFNGFKDWGNFDIVARQIASAGYSFVKFNFSHNGTTVNDPSSFGDLEAFGQNNFSKELFDVSYVIDWLFSEANPYRALMLLDSISLIGHSMGGGVAILAAARDARITKLITWAAISQATTPWGKWNEDALQAWKQSGVAYYFNARTKQQMPLYYQLYEDYQTNKESLDIRAAIQSLTIPVLICHGTSDDAVPVENAFLLKQWQPRAQLFTVDSNHVFGRTHPWLTDELPEAMDNIVAATVAFLHKK